MTPTPSASYHKRVELSEMDHPDVDRLLGEIRKKVIRGAKPTRHGRFKGAMRTVPIKHPTKPREYGRETLGEELNTMSLHDAIQRFRSVNEAALPAPAPQGQVASGKQTASKSKFTGTEPKDQQDYKRDKVSEPSDPEAKAAATRSTAGVKGPGYDATGRERVDVRHEQRGKQREDEGQDNFRSTPKNDQEDLEFAAAMLQDRVGDLRRRPVAEAGIPAPAPDQKTPDGKAQTASKSKFDDHVKPDKDYKGDAASIPADAEAKAAATRSTAGVSGPGYDASGREKVDVRFEQEDGIRPGEDADQAFVRQHGLA